MLSTLNPKEPSTQHARESDPHDVFVIDPEVVLAGRAEKVSPTLAPEAANRPASPQPQAADASAPPSLDATFRVTASDHIELPPDRSALKKWAKRAAVAFVLALCSAFATAAWKHNGDTARQMIASLVPQPIQQYVQATLPAQEKARLDEQASSPTAQAATAQEAAPQPESTQPAAPQSATPAQPASAAQTATAVAPDQAQLLQSMARDLATMGQQIEELRASIAQLKAGQDQMSRDIANASAARTAATVPSAQPRTAAAPPPARQAPAAAPPVRRPKPPPAYYPAQATAAPALPPPQPSPVQVAPERPATAEDGGPVVRPPRPVQ
jgi:hypothetical protein